MLIIINLQLCIGIIGSIPQQYNGTRKIINIVIQSPLQGHTVLNYFFTPFNEHKSQINC